MLAMMVDTGLKFHVVPSWLLNDLEVKVTDLEILCFRLKMFSPDTFNRAS